MSQLLATIVRDLANAGWIGFQSVGRSTHLCSAKVASARLGRPLASEINRASSRDSPPGFKSAAESGRDPWSESEIASALADDPSWKSVK
jgi:hypothetical protein